jgi:peptidoglycan/xylan/chitin deacetylase (PgdA/CDA1 family)
MSPSWQQVSAPRRNARLYWRRGLGFAGVVLALVAVGFFVVASVAGGGANSHHGPGKRVVASGPLALAPTRRSTPQSTLSGIEAIGDARIEWLARLGLPIYCAGPSGNEVAFTFDDGPGPYTYLALRKLRQAGERATFFVVGRSMNFFPGWLRRELAVAAIGDHTYTHPELPLLSPAQIVSEIITTEHMIQAQTGQRVYLFRPPYGARNAEVDQIVKRLGLLEIMWSMDSRDSLGANWAGIIHNAEAGLHPGAIILFHENRGQTIRALTTLLSVLHRRHLRSVSLPELFATDPPSVAQVRQGLAGCERQPRGSGRTGG